MVGEVKVMRENGGRLGMWRGALLGSVSLVAMACASDAEAACQGENTGNVLCDAAIRLPAGRFRRHSTAIPS